MNPTSQPYNGGPDSAHPSTAGEDNPAPLGAHEALVSQPKPGDDPGEFGIGILPNPKARYWQGRAAFWRNEAIARGYKITEEPDPPRDTWQRELLALADEIDRQARECPTVDWRPSAHQNARTLRELTRVLSAAAVAPLPVVHGDGGPEEDFIADGVHLNCPACGGSGHVDDAAPARTPGGEAWQRLETWLGTYADSIPSAAYHELCAIQKVIASAGGEVGRG